MFCTKQTLKEKSGKIYSEDIQYKKYELTTLIS